MKLLISVATTTLLLLTFPSTASTAREEHGSGARAFAQLDRELPTANDYRTASGAPGKDYWQQRVDYTIDASLDERARRITADATISYHNNAPDSLRYLWLQLDQNRYKADSLDRRSRSVSEDRVSYRNLRDHQSMSDSEYGYQNLSFTDARGNPLKVTIVDTMARLDLSTPLPPGDTFTFQVSWTFSVLDKTALSSRGGYEHFDDNTQMFGISQWFPRLAAYTDYSGWNNKAFLGRGEFTLEFGNYEVALTVPDNHIVAATGELANPEQVLTREQRTRLASANTETPVFVVTPEEARGNEQTQSSGQKTWIFKAENVRDFAWASSSKFIWDAMVHQQPGARHEEVLAMSFYPSEGEPIWSRYSTHAVVHTMDVYSRMSFDYPYPVAQSVNVRERGGMEYPMITFNGYRPDPPRAKADDPKHAHSLANDQKAYSRDIKYSLIGVIIHEIGHIYFPMVVNSDERQWTWMDEGLNTFLEYVAELEWEENYPAFGNEANLLDYIPAYMTSPNQVPVMTQSDSILQFGPNAYSKPAAALTVLRETVMGRELFDFAFREYARRWKFKRPTPADFFRTMEDASGIDLDWFWRAWFYTTDYVDIAITDIRAYRLKTGDPDIDFPEDRTEHSRDNPTPVSVLRNQAEGIRPRDSRYEDLQDYYTTHDRFTVSNKDRNDARSEREALEPWEQRAFERAVRENALFYFLDIENLGGVPSPVLMQIHYENGTQRDLEIPAEVWRRDARKVTYRLIENNAIKFVEIDRQHQTADVDYTNNRYPPEIRQSRLKAYKSKSKTRNLMADLLVELKAKDGSDEDSTGRSVPLEPEN